MAAAYAAVLSVAQSLHQILNLKQKIDPLHKEKIVSLHEKVDFLEDFSDKYHGKLDCISVGSGIKKAAYEAQDFIDSYLNSVSRSDYNPCSSKANCDAVPLDQDLNMVLERIDFILEVAMKFNNSDITADYLRPVNTYSSPVGPSSAFKTTAKNMVVGFEDDLNAIKERLYEDSAMVQIIPVVGMGGIGKTTLARRVYEDSLFAQYFDICGWTTVSMEYKKRDILVELLQSFNRSTNDHSEEYLGSAAELEMRVYQTLMGRRYLIVIDDIWSTKSWDDLKKIFPDDGSRSRILLTTRLSDVGIHATTSSILLHQMKFLNADQSWELLREKVFGRESCPLQLVEIGRKIARKCGGLPLTIMVVSGLLHSLGNMVREDLWENILENVSSTEPTIAQHCSNILCLSYDRLPLQLKPCFLYISAFPEDAIIDVSKLIKLWVAEGFIKPSDQSKCLEDVGEEYLDDLVNRSLIMVSKKEPDGKLKTIGIHDLLREICITKAEEQGFLYQVSSKRNSGEIDEENSSRRFSIVSISSYQEYQIHDPSVRSVLLFTDRYMEIRLSLYCRRLNILDAPRAIWKSFLKVIPRLVNLRYIAFALTEKSSPCGFPTSMSKLHHLQTIIASESYLGWDPLRSVPYEIWGKPKLRHLIMGKRLSLSYPSSIGISHESDLQTLETVVNFICTEEVVKLLVNLRKLKVLFRMDHRDWDDFHLHNLSHLRNLEELEVSVDKLPQPPSLIWDHAFPISLKKLSLRGVSFLWENMTIIGSLPNLQVLKMIDIEGDEPSKWTPIEGQFLRLKYFHSSLRHLVIWEAEKEHFPSLETLILRKVYSIHEIPSGIGEIDSLQLIELFNCKNSVVDSAKRIQEQQNENGNIALQVLVHDSNYNRRYLRYEFILNEHTSWEEYRLPV